MKDIKKLVFCLFVLVSIVGFSACKDKGNLPKYYFYFINQSTNLDINEEIDILTLEKQTNMPYFESISLGSFDKDIVSARVSNSSLFVKGLKSGRTRINFTIFCNSQRKDVSLDIIVRDNHKNITYTYTKNVDSGLANYNITLLRNGKEFSDFDYELIKENDRDFISLKVIKNTFIINCDIKIKFNIKIISKNTFDILTINSMDLK